MTYFELFPKNDTFRQNAENLTQDGKEDINGINELHSLL